LNPDNGISVIVCCYNSASRIRETLIHLKKQIVDGDLAWEIILIDNNSSDNTANLAASEMSDSDIPFRIFEEADPGLSNARNRGFKEAIYNIVLMVDDDNSLDNNYVQTVYDKFQEDPTIGMVGGKGIPNLVSEAPKWFTEYAYCYATGHQANVGEDAEHLYGAGLALRLDILDHLKKEGFKSLLSDRIGNSLMSGGDTELCYAYRMAGFRLVYVDYITFKHILPTNRINWSYLRRLFLGFGHTKAYMEAYTMAISGKPEPQEGRLPFWLDRAKFLLQTLSSEFPLLIKSLLVEMEGNTSLPPALAKWGHLKRIVHLKGDYLRNIQHVYALKRKLDLRK
jgi:glycosyltransferase involved in cell wall biosynthesis